MNEKDYTNAKNRCPKVKCNDDCCPVFRKVTISAAMGSDEPGQPFAPENGAYENALVYYEASGVSYIYSSDGLYTKIAVIEGGESAVNSVNGKTGNVVLNASDVGALPDSTVIPTVNDGKLTIQKNGTKIDDFTANSASSKTVNITVPTKTSDLNNDSSFQTSTNVDDKISTHNSANTAHPDIRQLVANEANARVGADNNLQGQIDAISASSDVKDIVGTYAELQAYDTSTLGNNDIIKVLQDENQNDETTYYRWSTTTETFTLIGEEGPYYTKAAADSQFVPQTRTVNNKALSSNISLDASDVSALPSSTKYGASIDASGTTLSLKDQDGNTLDTATTQDTTYTAGANVNISANNEISATDTTYSNFTGTDGQTAGTAGLVPAPATTDAGKFLKADGTWGTVGSGPTVVQTTGTSQTDVMSQNAVTGMVYNDPGTRRRVNIGGNSSSTGNWTVAIGDGAYTASTNAIAIMGNAQGESSAAIGVGSTTTSGKKAQVALGAYSGTTAQGEMNIGCPNYNTYGYNNSAYRLLTGLYDPQSAHDAANKQYVDNRVIQNAGAPTTLTVGTVGQLLEDTTNGDLYICTDATNPYTWEEVGAGGGGPTVVQTTGTSTTDVMSQNAVTSMVFANPGTNDKVRIVNTGSLGPYGISIGLNASGSISQGYTIGIGGGAKASGGSAIAIGMTASATAKGAVAFGAKSSATSVGEMNIGSSDTSYGYNSSNYRLLTGIYDGQSAHDAVNVGQINALIDAINTAAGTSIAHIGS